MKDKNEYTNTYDWLISYGFTDTDILNIKKIYNREGVKFCKKSFNINDFKDMKIELNKIKKEEQKDFYKELLSSVSDVDIDVALKQLISN
jgi:hypothetical protein